MKILNGFSCVITCWSSWQQILRSWPDRRRLCLPRGSFRPLLRPLTFRPNSSSRDAAQPLICIRFHLCQILWIKKNHNHFLISTKNLHMLSLRDSQDTDFQTDYFKAITNLRTGQKSRFHFGTPPKSFVFNYRRAAPEVRG